ncbi:hypothetical protein SDJN03_22806, partial [Cucurbita argyrosperma subsp. sororia]
MCANKDVGLHTSSLPPQQEDQGLSRESASAATTNAIAIAATTKAASNQLNHSLMGRSRRRPRHRRRTRNRLVLNQLNPTQLEKISKA